MKEYEENMKKYVDTYIGFGPPPHIYMGFETCKNSEYRLYIVVSGTWKHSTVIKLPPRLKDLKKF